MRVLWVLGTVEVDPAGPDQEIWEYNAGLKRTG